MPSESHSLAIRKKEHLEICSSDIAAFKKKTTGFEHYEFIHEANTEVQIESIDLSTNFFGKKISYPYLISCMTGGSDEVNNINLKLAVAAEALNIPLGIGSMRYAIDSKKHHHLLRELRLKAPRIPIFGNIGAAQIANLKDSSSIMRLASLIEADAMAIHLNPLQELLQRQGEPNFKGLMNSIEMICKEIEIPIIVKEVGSGISLNTAESLLNVGVAAIDTAGAGGTSWASVEILRNKDNKHWSFSEWGLPTSYSIRKTAELKTKYNFMLIGSGGVKSGHDIAKCYALGADFAASARPILLKLNEGGVNGVVAAVDDWFTEVKMIMFLTQSQKIEDLRNGKLVRTSELF